MRAQLANKIPEQIQVPERIAIEREVRTDRRKREALTRLPKQPHRGCGTRCGFGTVVCAGDPVRRGSV
jgi:hypothetical protein